MFVSICTAPPVHALTHARARALIPSAQAIDSTLEWVYGGRSPSRSSMDRLASRGRERSMSVSSSSSMREGSGLHPLAEPHPGLNLSALSGHHGHAAAALQQAQHSGGALPYAYASASSSPDHRRRQAAMAAQGTAALADAMHAQTL